jgi:hypothetical protein
MTIEQLLQMDIGQTTGGFELAIKKHPSKLVKIADRKWLQPVVFIDETGEIYAEIYMTAVNTLQKQMKIYIALCEIQHHSEKDKKLYINQWWIPSLDLQAFLEMDKYGKEEFINRDMQYGEPINIVKGKCRMHEVLKFRETNGFKEDIPDAVKAIMDNDINYILKDIMTGK